MYEYQNEFLYNKILAEDAAEEGIETEGDAILHQFYCGNWTQTMTYCVDNRIEPKDLIRYIEEKEHEFGKIQFYVWFDREFFAEYSYSYWAKKGEAILN